MNESYLYEEGWRNLHCAEPIDKKNSFNEMFLDDLVVAAKRKGPVKGSMFFLSLIHI